MEAVVRRSSTRQQHQLRCQAYDRRSARIVYCREHGHGKVKQHLGGPSVWSALGHSMVLSHSRHSARPYEAGGAGAKTRRQCMAATQA